MIRGGGKITDSQGAIVALGQSQLGSILLWVILVWLIGYGLGGVIRARTDQLHKGTDAEEAAIRVGYLISGLSYSHNSVNKPWPNM